MSIVLQGSTSGSITLQEPAVAGSTVLSLPATTGTVLTSASPSSDLPNSIKGPAFNAYLNVAQSISNATFTKVNFDTETFDTNNNFASSRFTPTVAGYYQVNYNVGLLITAGVLGLFLYKSGSPVTNGGYVAGSANIGGATWVTGSNLLFMNGTTDFLEVYVYQNSGGSSNTSTGQNGVSFNGAMVRAA